MRSLAFVCFTVAAVAEAGGLFFVVAAFRNNRAILRRWRAENPEHNGAGSYAQLLLLNPTIEELLDEPRWRQRLAVALISVGIAAGTVGNFTGLPS